MTYNIDLLNQACTDIGATAGHKYNIDAYNAICTYLGITAGHKYEIDSLNAIAVNNGLPGGYSYNIDALNAICETNYSLEVQCLAHLGTLVNYPDNAVVTTLTGNYIVSVDGKFILTVDGFVPLNAMRTLQGNPIVTKNNEYITI